MTHNTSQYQHDAARKTINLDNERGFTMKNFNLSLIAGALCALTTIAVSTRAHAEDFPQTTAAAQLSVTRGFNQASLPLLHRAAAADAATVGAALTAKLCPAPCFSKSTTGDRKTLRIVADHWSLNVVADGSSAEFQDRNVEARAHSLAKDPSQKISARALEQAGRDFIASHLSSVIVLGPEEGLLPVRTAYLREWTGDVRTGETKTAVVANRIVFGRTLHGVPVVGGGSTVIITFTNDGALESFRYDWPKYGAAKDQPVVDAGEILRRVQRVVIDRTGIPTTTFTVRVPANVSAPYPVALASDTELRELECGYYDPGFAARDGKAPVQPGCVYHAVFQGSDGTRAGYAGAVPGGIEFEPDGAWQEAQILRGNND